MVQLLQLLFIQVTTLNIVKRKHFYTMQATVMCQNMFTAMKQQKLPPKLFWWKHTRISLLNRTRINPQKGTFKLAFGHRFENLPSNICLAIDIESGLQKKKLPKTAFPNTTSSSKILTKSTKNSAKTWHIQIQLLYISWKKKTIFTPCMRSVTQTLQLNQPNNITMNIKEKIQSRTRIYSDNNSRNLL